MSLIVRNTSQDLGEWADYSTERDEEKLSELCNAILRESGQDEINRIEKMAIDVAVKSGIGPDSKFNGAYEKFRESMGKFQKYSKTDYINIRVIHHILNKNNPSNLLVDNQSKICDFLDRKDLFALHAAAKNGPMRKAVDKIFAEELNKSKKPLDNIFPGISKEITDGMDIVNFFGDSCKTIERLNLAGFSKLTDFSFLKYFKNLKYLNLAQLSITDTSVLKELTNLEALSLYFCLNINSFDFLKFLTKLKYLNLTNCIQRYYRLGRWYYESGFNYTTLNGLKSCKDLEVLILTYCDNFTDLSVLKNCKKLRVLDLQNTHVNDLSQLLNCLEIEEINLRYCYKLMSTDFILLQLLPKLQFLNLTLCKLEDLSFINQCKSIKKVIGFNTTACRHLQDSVNNKDLFNDLDLNDNLDCSLLYFENHFY